MAAFIQALAKNFDRFSRWFDQHFGWFFTNGMKNDRTLP